MFPAAVEWYLQRITGALLIILLVAHYWVEHYAMEPLRKGQLTYEVIFARISNPYWQATDISFLLIALYHGLSGLRNVILDSSRVGPRAGRVCTVVLIVVGMVWAYWGIEAFKNL